MQQICLFSLLFLTILGFSACSDESDQARKPDVFHYNQHISISSLDPAFAKSQNNIWGVDHLYNGLLALNQNLETTPALADSFNIDASGTIYTFHLNQNAFFHDNDCFENRVGRKVTADDVVYSFNRIIDSQVASPGSWIFKGKIDLNNPFEAVNDSTFVLRLLAPFRPMVGILTMQYCSIVPHEAVSYYGKNFRSNPVGTGPFVFKKWVEGQALFLQKNKKFFLGEKEDGVEALRVSFIPERKTAYLELMKGKIDYMSGLESSYTNELITREGNLRAHQQSKLNFVKGPYLNTEYLGINVRLADSIQSPLSNKKIRQALNYGINRKKMLQSLRNGIGQPADAGFIPRGLPSYNPKRVKGYTYNPSKARELLNEAGFPNGKGLPIIKITTNKDYLDLCTFITRQWQELGVEVEIELEETAILRQKMRKGQVGFFRASWIADYPDGESFLTVFYGKNAAPPNYTHFRNNRFDELYELALKENENEKRYALYHEMEDILIEEAPVVFLFYDETALFAGKNISGLQPNGINLLKVDQIKKSQNN